LKEDGEAALTPRSGFAPTGLRHSAQLWSDLPRRSKAKTGATTLGEESEIR